MVVLAGGFGTRIRATIGEIPKSLAPVGNKPFLEHLLEIWCDQGITRFIFALHYQAEILKDYITQASRSVLLDCEVVSVTEHRPLGTGGAVANAVKEVRLTGSFLVANSDTWLGNGLAQLAASAPPALIAIQVEDTSRYGSLSISGGKVTAFREKTEAGGRGFINAGMYHLHANLFEAWNGDPVSLEQTMLPDWSQRELLNAVRIETDFIDIGIPTDYGRFVDWVRSQQRTKL
jgi:D-glycero-alpha-D-manno-heptose 1-phosphate guanylyltransferase